MTDINARYIVITPADKGGCRIESLDPSVLLKRLEEEYYGPKKWSATIPTDNPDYWDRDIGVIIKGGYVVVPKAIQVATKYEL